MNDEQAEHHLQFLRQQILALRKGSSVDWETVDAGLEDLQVLYEQMQTNIEAAEVVQEELLLLKQYYQDLFQFFPIASLVTDANGVILEANQTLSQLLNVSRNYLIGKPLIVFIAEGDRVAFRTHLHQLSQSTGTQIWQQSLHPRNGTPIMAELQVAITRNIDGWIEYLRIGVYNLSQSQSVISHSQQRERLDRDLGTGALTGSQLPASLDGLRVLVVDDEADAREFVMAVLGAYGIHARAVASAAEALAELGQFRPDVLLSDIRMPDGDGYSLIRQIRALEADYGRHLPAAAMTAYVDEDREKAIAAGFEAHLHKLAQPTDWIAIVAELAGHPCNR
ncbi:response regulator [Pantanalinema rosaneae CENA516]|uniref:response regulator n=1 Tax=Pantanalinema rosaneae TaxID=1620701 RepID=UPI003D6EEDF5